MRQSPGAPADRSPVACRQCFQPAIVGGSRQDREFRVRLRQDPQTRLSPQNASRRAARISLRLATLISCGISVAAAPYPRWAKIELTFDGPELKGRGEPNPFAIRFDVVFSGPDGREWRVPGFYVMFKKARQIYAQLSGL